MQLEDLPMMFAKLCGVGLLILIVVSILLYKFQNKILYMPEIQGLPKSPKDNNVGMRSPADLSLKYEDIEIETDDKIKLKGWIVKQQNSESVPTVLYFHENAGNIGTRIYYMREYFQRTHFNIALIAYRGYSDSDGVPSEAGLMIDAQAILNHLFNRKDIDTSKIFLHGRSLGGAVTIYSASELKFKLCGIILENTFTSISDMVDVIFKRISFIKVLILRNFWPSIDRIGKISCPILFIQSLMDELVPPPHMTKLYKGAKSAKFTQLHVIPDGDHNGSWAKDVYSYFTTVEAFTKRCISD